MLKNGTKVTLPDGKKGKIQQFGYALHSCPGGLANDGTVAIYLVKLNNNQGYVEVPVSILDI